LTYALDHVFGSALIDCVLVGVADVPVGALLDVVKRLAGKVVARANLSFVLDDTFLPCFRPSYLGNAFEEGSLVVVPASVEQTLDIPLRLPTQRQEGLDLGSDQQSFVLNSPEQWLDTIPVSGCDQELLRFVEEDTGKFSSQVA
jgi:hypothetical protein